MRNDLNSGCGRIPAPSVDHLESRVLLAGVSLEGGTIIVDGSNGNDTVTLGVMMDAEGFNRFVVILNGQKTFFTIGTAQRLQASLGNGNDSLHFLDPDDNGLNATIYGGNGADTILGSYRPDLIYGGGGADHLDGWSGQDTVHGGGGSDTILMSQQAVRNAAVIYGENGNDTITTLARDTIYGDNGNDLITTGNQGVTVHGGLGNDTLLSGRGNDLLFGEGGDDSISGGGGNDSMYGGLGRDTLEGGQGSSLLVGGAGNDLLISQPGSPDTLLGQGGLDTLLGQNGEDVLIQ